MAELVPVLVETKDERLTKLKSQRPGYSPLQVVPLLGFAMGCEYKKRILRLQLKLGEKTSPKLGLGEIAGVGRITGLQESGYRSHSIRMPVKGGFRV